MVRKSMAAALLGLLAWAAAAQDVKTVIGNVSKAMGADGLKTVEYSGSGADFSLGQAMNPTSPWPRFNDPMYDRIIDFDKEASHVVRTRTQGENPPRGGGGQPLYGNQRQDQVVIFNEQTPWNQRLDLVMLPWGFLRAASAANATIETKKISGKKYTVISFDGGNKAKVNGYVDDQNRIARVETWVDNAVLGDMLYEADYSDYKDFNGVKFPMHILQKQGGWPTFELTVTDVKPNVAANIRQPAGRGGRDGRGGPGGPGAPGVAAPAEPEKLSDGVYLLPGAYAAVAVDMKDGILVIEGPQSEQRALEIISEAKRLIPGKPIKWVVNTHNHFDHASGLRTFVAEGATVITHQINKSYYEKVWSNPHTINPDKLSEAKVKPKFETMTEKKVLTDGNHVVELYHVKNSLHNDGMIMAYLPREKVIVEADEFNVVNTPDAPVNPYHVNLVENLERLKLDYDRIIPIHYPGRRVDRAELLRAAHK